MPDKSCYNCKHRTDSGELNIYDKNCAACLTNGGLIGFEEIEKEDNLNNICKQTVRRVNIVAFVLILMLLLEVSLLFLFDVFNKLATVITFTAIFLVALIILIHINRGDKFD